MRSARLAIGLLPLVLLLVGCNDDDTDTATTATTATTTATTAPPTSAAVTTAAPAATTTTAATQRVYLEPDGLAVASFDAPKDATVSTLTGLFGAPDATGTGCTLVGPDANTVRWKELSVQFVNGQFNAYT
ncbi:MAG: hypothetical protein M3144_05555, partial [Actinomycetota bacterium]|nr:hypothetical protein [Actinomycetota bacterium]